jgi:hypothetical protein
MNKHTQDSENNNHYNSIELAFPSHRIEVLGINY